MDRDQVHIHFMHSCVDTCVIILLLVNTHAGLSVTCFFLITTKHIGTVEYRTKVQLGSLTLLMPLCIISWNSHLSTANALISLAIACGNAPA